MTTRERKIQWLRNIGRYEINKLVEKIFSERGADWLTDEQIYDLTRKRVADWRNDLHFQMRNRKRRRINDHSRMD